MADLLQVSTKTVGLALFQPNQKEPFSGGAVSIKASSKSNKLTEDKLFNFDTNNSGSGNTDSGTLITLPKNIFTDATSTNALASAATVQQTLQFVYFQKDSLFTVVGDSDLDEVPNSSKSNNATNQSKSDNMPTMTVLNGVFSVTVGKTKSVKLSEDLQYTVATSLTINPENVRCVYWDFKKNGKF